MVGSDTGSRASCPKGATVSWAIWLQMGVSSNQGYDMTDVRCIWRGGAMLGEGPVWSAREQSLYWVDIKGRFVHRFKPDTREETSWSSPSAIGCIAQRRQGGFVCAHQRGFAFLNLSMRGKVGLEPICDPSGGRPGTRFNDGKCDPDGGLIAGTMDDAERDDRGAFYRLGPRLEATTMDQGFRVTNGPAFAPDGRTMYAADSAKQTVYAYDWAPGGIISNKRVFAQLADGEGYPDGMTCDADGHLWVAIWDGWRVARFDQNGKVASTIPVPVQRPTSVCFGGPDLDQLFITSASIGLTAEQKAGQRDAGGVFRVKPGVEGFAAAEFAG